MLHACEHKYPSAPALPLRYLDFGLYLSLRSGLVSALVFQEVGLCG